MPTCFSPCFKEATGIEGAIDSRFTRLSEFLQDVYNYILGPDFVGSVLASLLVAFLGVIVFRLLALACHRILRWRRGTGSHSWTRRL